MAGIAAGLPAGIRLSDFISLGVIARAVPPERVRQVLAETGRASERERDLPAQVMVYYAIALALYMGSSTREGLRCLLEGLRWLWGAEAVRVAGKSQYCSLWLIWIVDCRSDDARWAAMAGVPGGRAAGIRLSDHISLGVIARAVPPERIRQVLAETGKASEPMPSPWRSTWVRARARCCAACWRGYAGCGAPRRCG